jgi:hypothetical protein
MEKRAMIITCLARECRHNRDLSCLREWDGKIVLIDVQGNCHQKEIVEEDSDEGTPAS